MGLVAINCANGVQLMVGTGWGECGRDAYGGLVGGTDRWVGGDIRDGDRDGLNRWEDNVSTITLGTDHNATLAYVLGLEHHHPIMSTIGESGGRFDRERELYEWVGSHKVSSRY